MATQNIAPSAHPSSQKGVQSAQVGPKDGHSVTKRLQQDLMTLMMSCDPSVSAFPDGDNLFHWIATIVGAAGTVYDGLMYKLSLTFPSRYPYIPPVVKFVTPCYHPNVDHNGNICLDILKSADSLIPSLSLQLFCHLPYEKPSEEKWSALYDVRTILLSIQSLLAEPNNDSPLNVDAAELWTNQAEYKVVLMQRYKDATKDRVE